MNNFNLKNIIKIILIILVSLIPFSSLQAELSDDEFIIKQKKFILSLYKERKYFDCISETRRLLYFDPDNERKYNYFINACYYLGERYKTIINKHNHIRNSGKEIQPSDIFILSHAYYNIGNIDESRDLLFSIDYKTLKADRIKLFNYRLEFLLREFEFEKIQPEISEVETYFNMDIDSYQFNTLSEDIKKYNNINIKSKWLSVAVSSLLPGAGQAYSGRVFDGLISFAAVAGSAACTYLFYKKNEKSLMITFSFLTGLFYAGNIYGAYNSAADNNIKRNQQFSDSIIKKYSLSYDPMRDFDMSVLK